MFRFLTAGESHCPGLAINVEGVPAGVSLTEKYIAAQLAGRQHGYGRGGRMKFFPVFVALTTAVVIAAAAETSTKDLRPPFKPQQARQRARPWSLQPNLRPSLHRPLLRLRHSPLLPRGPRPWSLQRPALRPRQSLPHRPSRRSHLLPLFQWIAQAQRPLRHRRQGPIQSHQQQWRP